MSCLSDELIGFRSIYQLGEAVSTLSGPLFLSSSLLPRLSFVAYNTTIDRGLASDLPFSISRKDRLIFEWDELLAGSRHGISNSVLAR